MKKSDNIYLNMIIVFLLIATVFSWAVSYIRYHEITTAIAEITAEIEKQKQIRAEAENRWLNINEDDFKKITREIEPPCPIKVRDSIVFCDVFPSDERELRGKL